MLNFGALIAFMGVNVSSFVRYFLRAERKQVGSLLVPVLGFVICLYLWLSLGSHGEEGRICLAGDRCALRRLAHIVVPQADGLRADYHRRGTHFNRYYT